MTGVAELLATAGESAPLQRVRNYYLTDREASPRPRDFLTAMKRSDGAVCVRWAGPPGGCIVRHTNPGWECAKHNRFRGRTTVETLDAERVRAWLRRSDPELVAHEAVRAAFEEPCTSPRRARSGTALADGGQDTETTRQDPEAPKGSETTKRDSETARQNTKTANHVRVESHADVFGDSELDRLDARAIAAALPSAPGRVVFRLPLVLAEESVLESVPGSDCVFVAEPVPQRETKCAYYVRQDRRGCWVPKAEVTTYELADGVVLDVEPPECPKPTESPESA
jgi:hypothetical protein